MRYLAEKCLIIYNYYLAGAKGHVKLMQRVRKAHSFLQFVISVSLFHFKLANVVLRMAVKEFFESHFLQQKLRPLSQLCGSVLRVIVVSFDNTTS